MSLLQSLCLRRSWGDGLSCNWLQPALRPWTPDTPAAGTSHTWGALTTGTGLQAFALFPLLTMAMLFLPIIACSNPWPPNPSQCSSDTAFWKPVDWPLTRSLSLHAQEHPCTPKHPLSLPGPLVKELGLSSCLWERPVGLLQMTDLVAGPVRTAGRVEAGVGDQLGRQEKQATTCQGQVTSGLGSRAA